MAKLTKQQIMVVDMEARKAGLALAQTMGGYSALGGLAIGGMYAQKADKPILAGAGLVGGLIAGILGGYFAGSMKAKKQLTEDPALIPMQDYLAKLETVAPVAPALVPVAPEEEFVGPPNPEW